MSKKLSHFEDSKYSLVFDVSHTWGGLLSINRNSILFIDIDRNTILIKMQTIFIEFSSHNL